MKMKEVYILKKDKKAMSAIVTTVILVALSLVAIGVVWVVLSNIITQQTEEIDSAKFVSVNIKKVNETEDELFVTVERGIGQGEVNNLKFYVKYTDGNITEINKNISLEQGDIRTIKLPLEEGKEFESVSINAVNTQDNEEKQKSDSDDEQGETENSISGSLVSKWTMDDIKGDTLIDSNGRYNGTIIGKTFNHGTVNGNVQITNGAMVFDGVGDYVDLEKPDNLKFGDDDFTANIWIKPESTQSYGGSGLGFFGDADFKNGGWMFSIEDNGIYRILINSDDSPRAFKLGNFTTDWTMLTLVHNSSENKYYAYKNGDQNDSIEFTGTKSNKNILIGRGSQGGWTGIFNGSITDVQIYNKPLSPTEIKAQYDLGKGKYANTGEGLIAQYSGRDYSGTASNPDKIYDTNHLSNGKINAAFNFNGNDYIDVGNIGINFSGSSNYSVSVWMKTINKINKDFIIGTGAIYGWNIRTDNSGEKLFIMISDYWNNDASGPGKTIITNGNWHHVVMVQNNTSPKNGNLKGYVNGQEEINVSYSKIGSFNNNYLKIGKLRRGYFKGSIDDVRIYNRSLTANEIADLYEY